MMHLASKPLSSVAVEVTAANFPALKHFWPCSETSLASGLTDTVGGVVTGAIEGTPDGHKITAAGQTANTAIASGTLAAPGANNVIVLAVGQFNNAILNVGNVLATGGFQIIQTLGAARSYDGTTLNATASSVFGAAVEGHAIVQVPSTSLTAYRLQSGGTYGANGTADTTGIPATMAAIAQATTFGIGGGGAPLNSLYGLAVFHFETLPADLATAMQWMYHEWVTNNNKAIYPGWKDRS